MPRKWKNLNCGIYKIENILTNDFYIGKSVDLCRRKKDHFKSLKNKNHANKHLQRSYDKYGEENFVFKILLYCEPFELIYYEQCFVDIFNPAYNICKECVDNWLGVNHTEESKMKMSKANSGENHPNFGKHLTKETKHLISVANKGKVRTEEAIKNLSDSHKGKPASEEFKKYLSEKYKGEGHPGFGIPRSDETKRKLSIINLLDKNIVIKIKNMLDDGFSVKDIVNITGVCRETVRKVKKGGYKDAYGI